MGSKYSTVTVSGYNASPPSDDGSQTAANQVKWSTIKTKLPDPLKTAIEAVNSALVTFVDFGSRQVTSNDTTTAADHMKTIEIGPLVSTSITVSLGDAATMAAGYVISVKNSSANAQTIGRATAGDKIDGVAANYTLPSKTSLTFKVANTASEGYLVVDQSGAFGYDKADPTKAYVLQAPNISPATTLNIRLTNFPAGMIAPYAGATIPTGWLECDGSAVSRTTYSALFTALSTTWGIGDGSTTFNVPDFRDKVPIGSGTGTVAETVAFSALDVSANSIAVTSNTNKWITGMAVVFTTTANAPNPLSAGSTYYTIRNTATTIKLATSLANAQNGTAIDLTTQGSGNHTFTHTYTARTLGEYGGEESHAMSSTELLAHVHATHGGNGTLDVGNFIASAVSDGTDVNTLSTGSNVAMNIMQPFGVVKYIISY